MGEIIAFGLDVAKHVFQVQGVDDQVSAAFRCKLRRSEILEFFGKLRGCLVGWRHAPPPIIGLRKFGLWGTKCGSRRPVRCQRHWRTDRPLANRGRTSIAPR
jgi:hypothetical protein